MLNESARFATIEKLKALAEHPNTAPEEADNARRRMAEIWERIQRERTQVRRSVPAVEHTPAHAPAHKPTPFKTVNRRGVSELKNRRRAVPVENEYTMKDEWPFGWVGPKVPIEYESMVNPATGELVVGWKCPSCGDHVTRVIDHRTILRVRGQRGGMEHFMNRLTNGAVNQLCWQCWKLWNNK